MDTAASRSYDELVLSGVQPLKQGIGLWSLWESFCSNISWHHLCCQRGSFLPRKGGKEKTTIMPTAAADLILSLLHIQPSFVSSIPPPTQHLAHP